VAGLGDRRVVSAGDDMCVLVWDLDAPDTEPLELHCSVTALAVETRSRSESCLVVAQEGTGFSLWSAIDKSSRGTTSTSHR
jgi:hypothetical protein